MLAWATAAALACATCGALGFSRLLAFMPVGQGMALIMMAVSALVFFGALEAYETRMTSPPDPPEDG
jgi:hypothetical protein